MNWLTTSSGAPISAQDRSPSRIRSSCSLRAIRAAASVVSSRCTPSSTSNPGPVIAPTTAPSTSTAARRTRAATALTRAPAGRAGRTRARPGAWPAPARPPAGRGRTPAAPPARRARARRGSPPAAPRPGRRPRGASAGRPAARPRRPTSSQPSAARHGVALQDGGGGEGQPGAEQGVVAGVRAEPVDAVEPPLDLRAERVVDLAGNVLEHDRRRSLGAPQRDDPEADGLDVAGLHPVQPPPGLFAGGRRGEVQAGVALPGADVQRRVGHLALHHPRVDAVGQPGADAVGPVRAAHVQPGAEQLRDAAGGEMGRERAHERGERVVAALAGVPVDVVDAWWPRHERGVGHDLVEPPSRHGFQPRPGQQLDVEAVEGERGLGEGQRAGREIGRRDRVRVPDRVQRLHPAPGAEVEHGAHGPPDGGRGQGQRRRADAGDVVAFLPPQRPGRRAPTSPRLRRRRRGAGPGRPSSRRRPGTAQEAGRRRVGRRERGQRGLDRGVRLDGAEQQQPDQDAELACPRGGAARGLGFAAAERGVRVAAEQGPDTVGVVAGAEQRGPQGGADGGGEPGEHGTRLSPASRTQEDPVVLTLAQDAGGRRAARPRSARAAHRDAARPAVPDGARLRLSRGARPAARRRPARRARAGRLRPGGAGRGLPRPTGAAPLPGIDGPAGAGARPPARRAVRRRRHRGLARRRRRSRAVPPARRAARASARRRRRSSPRCSASSAA